MLKRLLILYVLVGCVASTVVFCIVYYAAWVSLREEPKNRLRQYRTVSVIQALTYQISQYQKERKTLPANLTGDYFAELPFLLRLGFDQERGPLDAWGRPIVYEVNGQDFMVYSLGRDGRPGGIGVDADLYDDPDRGGPREPSLEQFVRTTDNEEISGSNVFLWAVFSVIAVFSILFIDLLGPNVGSNISSAERKAFLRRQIRTDGLVASVFTIVDPQKSVKARCVAMLRILGGALFMVIVAYLLSIPLLVLHVNSGH